MHAINRRIATTVISIAVLTGVSAAPVRAQTAQPVKPAPVTQVPQSSIIEPIGFRGYLAVDSTSMMAKQTFDAVFGKSTLVSAGFGGEILNIYKRLFLRLAVSSVDVTGERAVVFDGEVVPLGIPLTLKLRPIEIGGGWRLNSHANGRIVPYVGAGLLRISYEEVSDFGEGDDNSSETFNGLNVFGGVEVRVAPWVIAGVEAQFRNVSDALGDGGLSKEFGESNLGGTTVRFLIGVRR